MQRGTRELGRSIITQVVGLPRSDRIRALQEFFPQDELSQNEMLSLLDLYDALGVSPDAAAASGTPSLAPPDEVEANAPGVPPSALLEAGKSYGPYRVVRPLGAGGMGQVFLAEDIRLGRHVALKSLAGKWLASPSARQRLMREARAVGVLAHPNIATLYDVLEDGPRLLLVMEYVDGKTVKEMIDAGAIPAGQVLRVAVQVAGAIGYAHDRGVIHCDLKPANIQVAPDGIAKVLDFGLARVKYAEPDAPQQSLTGTGVMLGTPGYVAPERLLSGVLNASGDIYSIGVVLFEMATGRRLFDRGTPEHLFDTVSGRTVRASSFAPSLPHGLDDVIERALSVDPRLRYQSAHELSRDLHAILKALDTASVPLIVPAGPSITRDSAISEGWRWSRAAAAAIAAVGIVGFAGFVTSGIYNLGLARTADFDPESPLFYFVWGMRSLVAPAALGAVALVGVAAASAILRAPLKAAAPLTARLLPASTRARGWRPIASVPVTFIAPALLVIELVSFWLLWTRFESLLDAVFSFVRGRSSEHFGALNPANADQQVAYRVLLSLHLIVFSAAWLAILNSRARRAASEVRVVVAGGIALTVLSFLLLIAPYRILLHGESERVMFGAQRCYLVGQHGVDALLFCPTQPPPWSRVVRTTDPNLKRDGTRESIFKEVR